MFRKLVWGMLAAAFACLTSIAAAQDAGGNAYLRVLQLANDGALLSLTLPDGTTPLANFAPGSVSDYMPFATDRSTLVTLRITPAGGLSFNRGWAVPPLTPGYHTAAVVGSARDGTLELIFIDEDAVCAGKLAGSSCVILVNNIQGSPSLSLIANSTPVVEDAHDRQAVVGEIGAGTYLSLRAVSQVDPQTVIFRLPRRFFEPNVIYIYTLRGRYPGANPNDYVVGTLRRSPVDSMTFLRGLTANPQLSDGTTLFATENIVAILEQAGLDTLLSNPRLPLTVFAPTDGAVLELLPDLYDCVISNPSAMRALILNHIIVGDYTPSELAIAQRLPTMAGTLHTFRAANGEIVVDNTASVSDAVRYPTLNGSVYVTDTVLVPPGFDDQFCTSG
ncbi:MAG: fasciclin domain-containing protein [Anaerolineae bacterium]